MDLTLVKAELKAWERDFKSNNGRDPSKADIKAVPEIGQARRLTPYTRILTFYYYLTAEKYRLYSKARSDKSAPVPAPAKPAPSASAAPPVTPSKRAARQHPQEDSFKTPCRSSATRTNGAAIPDAAAASPTAGGTQFAYAPSPSRLRALAASRSFSGSPNKKGGLAAQEASSAFSNAPVNLGKSFVLPPTVDTPRTKAKRWLAGDAVSPPVKLRYNSHATASLAPQASTSGTSQAQPPKRANGSKADFWQQMEQRRSATPAEDVGRNDTQMQEDNNEDNTNNVMNDDEDFLAPSPVKPAVPKANGKGKQRQRIDLFGNGDASNTTQTNGAEKRSTSIPGKKITATPITSFFSAKPPSSRMPMNGDEEQKPYIPGISKPKKRTIAAAAIVPTISEDFDKIEEPDLPPPPVDTNSRAKKKTDGKGETRKEETQEAVAGPSDRSKRLRKDPAPLNNETERESDTMQDDTADSYDEAYDSEVLAAIEAEDDDYDTRDLSDEYEEYKPRRRSVTPAMLSQTQREASAVPLDQSLDPDLVSLLSLKASPVKNRLAKLQKKREDTYRKLLHEPTYLMESKKQIKGLEDLEEEERRKREEAMEAAAEPAWTTDLFEDEAMGTHKALDNAEDGEQSDDDWASEPEGWKDLSDGEMPNDSF